MNTKKRIAIIGATSLIAEHCARLWVEGEPTDLILVGRDLQRLDRIAADLRIRSPQSEIKTLQADFLDPIAIHATVERIFQSGQVDTVLIAQGSLPDQADCQVDLRHCRDAIEINAISPVLYAEAFARQMEANNSGTIVLMSSVAGDRGRKSNYVYGAAKGLITRYAQGLQHRFTGTGVNILIIKPGPTDTPMTAHLKASGAKLASVENVAKRIVEGAKLGKSVIYAPGQWKLIMFVIRHLPEAIFKKMNI